MPATKRRYVHIGYPKSASTTVQNTFLSSHPNLFHLGNGYKGGNNTYIDDGVELAAEVILRYRKDFAYDPVKTRAPFVPHFEAAEADASVHAVGFSSEFFCFTLSQEIDVTAKARRLHDIFGDNTSIIFVFREQFSLLRSLYLEMIRGGFYLNFRKFIEYTYLFQDRSWCYDFCYDKMYDLYAGIFGKENVVPVPFELLKKSEPEFMKVITDGIGVPAMTKALPKMNAGKEDKGFYEHLRRLNEKARHEFGSAFYEPFSSMRMRTFFHNELSVAVPKDRLADDALRMPLSQTAKKLQDNDPLPDIDLAIPKAMEERLAALYGASNTKFAERTGIDLASYGYRLA